MKIVVPLVINILAPLEITATGLAIDAGMQRKMHDSGATTLIISKEEMNEVFKIVQALQVSNILLKGITKIIENEKKEQKGKFLGML